MIDSAKPTSAKAFIEQFAARGRHHFSSAEARKALGVSAAASKLALLRLARQKLVATPARGFYIIVPPEYRSLGSLPPEQFLPALMQHLKLPYYVGLLSAAQYHGSAHQRPQTFQVMLAKPRRPLRCGKVNVVFFVRDKIDEVPVQSVNTPRGTLMISTPEATACDLVGYQKRIGGLDQAATVLSELHERIDPRKLLEAARTVPVSWAQRLGFLLEAVGAHKKTGLLKSYVAKTAHINTPLVPGLAATTVRIDEGWKIRVNHILEADL